MAPKRATSLIFSFLLLLFWAAVALQAGRPGVKPGFKLGGGLANNFGQDTYEQKWQGTLAGGLFVDLRLNKRLGAEVEVLFFRKGSVYRLNLDGSEYREKYILDYLEIPVFVKFFVLEKDRYNFYLYAGPSIGFNLGARLKVTFDGLEESVSVDNLKGADLLLNGGAGVEYKLKDSSLILELRYNQGLKSISTETEEDFRNKALVILVGYRF